VIPCIHDVIDRATVKGHPADLNTCAARKTPSSVTGGVTFSGTTAESLSPSFANIGVCSKPIAREHAQNTAFALEASESAGCY
jgi:hypothetical protein